MDDKIKAFQEDCAKEIQLQGEDLALKEKSLEWLLHANSKKYSYHFSWMGRPIIQYPQDIQMMQELVMRVKPDLIIETGIAHGGSALFSASMLALLDLSDALQRKQPYDPLLTKRKVIAIDIDIREHNKKQILENPFSNYLEMIEGSSIDASVVERVSNEASKFERVMIFLDSNHTHEHVLEELRLGKVFRDRSRGRWCRFFFAQIFEPTAQWSDPQVLRHESRLPIVTVCVERVVNCQAAEPTKMRSRFELIK